MKKKIFLTTLPENLIKIQKSSFYWFLNEGLRENLNTYTMFSKLNKGIEIRYYFNESKYKAPKETLREAKANGSTYSFSIFIPMEIVEKSGKISYQKDTFLTTIPLMTSRGTFCINGHERVVINQIIRSPGIYFKINQGTKKYITATLISSKGPWLYWEYIDGLIWIKFEKTNKIPISFLLDYLESNTGEILSRSSNYFKYFQYLRNNISLYAENLVLNQKEKKDISKLFKEQIKKGKFTYLKKFLHKKIFGETSLYNIGKIGRYKLNLKLNLNIPENFTRLTALDMIHIIDLLLQIDKYPEKVEHIDDLANRRIRSVGEMLNRQISIGLKKLENLVKSDMVEDKEEILGSTLVEDSIYEFFTVNPLSQYLDQINALSELTHKRKISCLGPGGINGDHVSFDVRDIHPSYYGRLCPIETPDGEKVGLISSLALYGRVNTYGFIEAPFLPVKNGKILGIPSLVYLNPNEEKQKVFATGDLCIDRTKNIINKQIAIIKNETFSVLSPNKLDYVPLSPIQIFAPGICLIPFFEHDDANRALMGSTMQKQAVPLIRPQKPLIGSGIENQLGFQASFTLVSYSEGIVNFVSSNQITIVDKFQNEINYFLEKFKKSNYETCINQRPLVWVGESIKYNQILADGPSTDEGELALGQNLTVAYMPWEGYNFEDAIIINERLIYENIFTSMHIEKYEFSLKQTTEGPERLTRDLPGLSFFSRRNLDKNGIIIKGTSVFGGDILIGRLTPKPKSQETQASKLYKEITGLGIADFEETSLRVPQGTDGLILDIQISTTKNSSRCLENKKLKINTLIEDNFLLEKKEKIKNKKTRKKQKTEEEKYPLRNEILYSFTIFLAYLKKVQIGDKLAGRHGNKGVIATIVTKEDMPFLPDGSIVDIILNPLGVPSRMNVGQIFECFLGLIMDKLEHRFKIYPFDEMYKLEASRILINEKVHYMVKKTNNKWLLNSYSPGKIFLRDGREGDLFDNPSTVGKAYILKLIHLVDEKIHGRAIGPYSAITQQPVKGKAKQGGQRFGEMEVWALEAYGAATTLQELLTVKSDDIVNRTKYYQAIVTGKPLPNPDIPESFRVLLHELKSLAIDVKILRPRTKKK